MKKLLLLFFVTFLFSYDVDFVTCKDIKNLTPVQKTTTFTTKDKKVYAFAYFKNIEENKLIDFVWEKNVNDVWKVYADIKLPIYKGMRWRTYSNIKIRKYFTGKWRVSLYDDNTLIDSIEFEIKDTNNSK